MPHTINEDGSVRVTLNPALSSVTPGGETRTNKENIGFQKDYLKSPPGILKVLEIVLSLIGFIASVTGWWIGSGWVSWVTMSAFLTASILFVVHAFNVYPRLPGFWPLYELMHRILYTLMYVIAVIICIAAAATGTSVVGLIVCVGALGVFSLDAVMGYRRFKEAQEERQREKVEGAATRQQETSFCIIF